MTPLRRPVRRKTEVNVFDGGRMLTIAWEARRDGLYLWQFGTRTKYLLPWRTAYECAGRIAGEQRRREKAAEKARKRSRGAA